MTIDQSTVIPEWRPVVGYEGLYEVSSAGLVRRSCAGRRTRVGRICKPTPDDDGYLRVGLCRNGQERKFRVHVLVARAFLGPYPEGKQVNHKDRDRANAAVGNLEYLTPSENVAHAYANNPGARIPRVRGEQSGTAKLTEVAVRAIRASTEPTPVLARRHGVTRAQVRLIQRRLSWKHVA